jgi:hypothetical protein
MSDKKYLPPENLDNPFIKDLDEYKSMYHQSIDESPSILWSAS